MLILDLYLYAMPIIFVVGLIMLAVINQTNELSENDLAIGFLAILGLIIGWPLFTVLGILYGLWLLLNLIVKIIITKLEAGNQIKSQAEIPPEVKLLSGAELDALLTKEFEEKMGWNNKN